MTSRRTFTARAHREGAWWVAEVDDEGIATQAKRLDLLEDAIRDLIVAWLQLRAESFDIVISPDVPRAAAAPLRRARRARQECERSQDTAAKATRDAAAALIDAGLTLRDAGTLLGVSHQRVAQLLASEGRRAG